MIMLLIGVSTAPTFPSGTEVEVVSFDSSEKIMGKSNTAIRKRTCHRLHL